MSYSSWGYMTCEPFVYWGNLHHDWIDFVRKVDVCEYIGKYRYIQDALHYLDKVEFVSSDNYISEKDLDLDWFLSRRGKINHCFSEYDWECEILFPLNRNKFPFTFVEEKEIQDAIEYWDEDRETICSEVPDPCQNEEELKSFIESNCDIGEQCEYLSLWDIKINAPDSHLEQYQTERNFDEHMGMDVLLEFLAQGGVVNRDFENWLVSFHMVGEDGREFCWARQIEGNEVVNPNQPKSLW